MSINCNMCETEIKTSKPIYLFSDTLFQENGRWTEHLTQDNLCSFKCLTELFEDSEAEGVQDKEGAECSVCKAKFMAGHIVSVGWKKTQRERWHKIITTRQYCSHNCMHKDFKDKKSPLQMEVPKKPAKKRKSTKKKSAKKKTTRKKKKS